MKNYFAHGSCPEVGQKQKTEGKKKTRLCLAASNSFCLGPDLDPYLDLDLDPYLDPYLDLDHDPDLRS